MIYTVIFAGGTGQRMNTVSLPKQFLKVHGKEIIIHTIEKYQKCSRIDGIVVVCLEDYIPFMKSLVDKYQLRKIIDVIPGGDCGQLSIFNGINRVMKESKNERDIVLIHDGVRPLIDEKTILNNIECVEKNGNAVTVTKSVETILILDDNKEVADVVDRSKCYAGRAPQGFLLNDIYEAHLKAQEMGKLDFIDSAMLMRYFGHNMHTVIGPDNNIKVTTPMDFYMFKAMLDAEENLQIRVESNE